MTRLLAFFALLSSAVMLSAQEAPKLTPPSDQWEKDIAAFEKADKEKMPPADGIEFVGSSTIRRWKPTMATDFPDLPVFNRGFGGSKSSDVLKYFDRIVLPYKPKVVVFYAGDNDLSAGVSGEKVVETWKQLMARFKKDLPQTRVFYISIRPSAKRASLEGVQKQVNKEIEALLKNEERMHFVNVWQALLNDEGKANEALLDKDKLHLNDLGYRLLRRILTPMLEQAMTMK